MVLRVASWLCRFGRVHRVHLEDAGAAVVCRSERVGVAVVRGVLLLVRLHLVHVASAVSEILSDLPLHLGSSTVRPL